MVQKAVHPENVPCADLPILENAIFQQFHALVPLRLSRQSGFPPILKKAEPHVCLL